MNVLIATWIPEELVDRIRAVDERVLVTFRPDLLPTPRYPSDHDGQPRDLSPEQADEWNRLLSNAEVMLGLDFLDPPTLARRAPLLRWIQGTSAGMAGYLATAHLPPKTVTVTTAAGLHGRPLAEFVLLATLYFLKDLPRLQAAQRDRSWARHAVRELRGLRAAVVGLGAVGREVARSLTDLGVEVVGARRSAGEVAPPGVSTLFAVERLHEVLPSIDLLVLAAPATPATRHLVGRRELAAMKEDAILVNIGRGSLIDEPALIEWLRAGRIAGAGLDVFEQEPLPPDNPLWSMPNVLVSPHSASTVVGENERLTELFADNLRRYLDGRPLRNLFDWDRGY
jgi:glyoxylate/hydroxypyruvate reductase